MLRACVLEFQGSWDEYISLMEFTYNNQFHSSIGMTPYEALYGRKCRSPVYWDKEGMMILEGTDIVQNMMDKDKYYKREIEGSSRSTEELCGSK